MDFPDFSFLGPYPCLPLKLRRDYPEPICIFSRRRLSEMCDELAKSLKFKLKNILQCTVCEELRRSAMFQCKYGHLICAGCFGEILNRSRLQNEIASCPRCRSTISKDLCSRNVAVEKTISELPIKCPFCHSEVPPDSFLTHKKNLCEKRPAICCNYFLGCPWKGEYWIKMNHDEKCKQLSASGHDILKALTVLDNENNKEVVQYEKIFELLSVEKFSYFDVQFKASSCELSPLNFETSKFSAFDNLWLVMGHIQDPFVFEYKLALKTKLTSPLSVHYLLVKGPYNDMEVKPQLCHFTFSDKASESPFQNLRFWYNIRSFENRFMDARIDFRIFLFINK